MRRAEEGSAGFTLLEVLVGLALMAILSIVLVTALRTGIGLWERRAAMGDAAELAAAFRALQSNLERALPIPECRNDQTNVCPIAFDGGESELRVVVANPGRVGRLGDAVLRLSIDCSGRQPALTIAWQVYDPAIGIHVDDFRETLLLLEDIEQAEFVYFGGATDEPSQRDWRADWKGRTTLPTAIRVAVTAKTWRQSWTFKLVNSL